MSKISIRHILPTLLLAALPMTSFAYVSVGVSINVAPPALPVYVQPPCPAVGYMWTPGYWAWGDFGYYWVPGTWVMAPAPGLLWTPGYWGWVDGAYLWHGGYWGPHIGFYGGVNYGYGYGGVGFAGGEWRGGSFYYNRSVTNVTNVNVTNVYNRTVINNVNVNRVSYNGGAGGLNSRPTSTEMRASRDRHIDATAQQVSQRNLAASNRELRASVNGGRPAIAATERPGNFTGRGVVAARAAGGPVPNASGPRGGASNRAAQMRNERPDRPPQAQRGNGGVAPAGRMPSGQTAQMRNERADRPPQMQHGNNGAARVPGGQARNLPERSAQPHNSPQPRNFEAPRNAQQPRNFEQPRNFSQPRNAPQENAYRAPNPYGGGRAQPQRAEPRPQQGRPPQQARGGREEHHGRR